MMSSGETTGEPSTAARLDRLFETFHSRTEPEPPSAVVAAGVSAILGYSISGDVIVDLRNGADGDPTVLGAVAQYFGVPDTYLTESGPEVVQLHRKLELLAAARDSGVQRLAMRGGTDSDSTVLDTVLDILRSVDGH